MTRILVVDDMESHLYLAKSLLEPFGYEVILAAGQEEALQKLAKGDAQIDLILSDISMPKGTGFEFIQSVKADERLRNIPFVFITAAYWADADKQKGLSLGAAKFIFRPLEARAILTELEEVLPPEKRMSSSQKLAESEKDL
jgi:CheY-like chemotaxis protein